MKNKILYFVLGIGLILILVAGIEMVSAEATGYALKFDGDDYVEIPNSLSLNPEQITIQAWVYPTAMPSPSGFIISKYQAQYNLYLYDDLPYPKGVWSDVETESGWVLVGDDNLFVYDKWQFLELTYDGSFVKLFIDGNEKSSVSATGTLATSTENVLIGIMQIVPLVNGFYGLIDEVKIYSETELVAYWDFNEGTGTTAIDNSAYGNNGTIYGAVYEEIPEPEPEPAGIIDAGFEDYTMASTTAYIGDLINSAGGYIYLFIGIPFGFFVIMEVIGMIKDRKIFGKK